MRSPALARLPSSRTWPVRSSFSSRPWPSAGKCRLNQRSSLWSASSCLISICCTPFMGVSQHERRDESSRRAVAWQPLQQSIRRHQIGADLRHLIETGIGRARNGIGGKDEAEIAIGGGVDGGPGRGREIGAADDDGGDTEGLEVLFDRSLEKGGKSRLVADPLLRPDLLHLAVQKQIGLQTQPRCRFQIVDDLGAESARHDNTLASLDQRAMAQIDIGAVAAIEADHVDDGRVMRAERFDQVAHLRCRRAAAADCRWCTWIYEIALSIDGEQRGLLALRRQIILHPRTLIMVSTNCRSWDWPNPPRSSHKRRP